ncbi:hypothetical protein [Chitinophaga rhizosphaerae]|uniref:hypothetical protein n=1 Tax=Chitinophaga rhizosphaerae TaxID=1864947 RepID=UPI000F8136DF|nr:hypothetical protein [Chitinophaga rhizosphaerae]
MSPERIDKLEQNLLALRKIADWLLEEVRAEKSASPARRQNKRQARVVDLKTRILCGRLKPDHLRTPKTKKA